MAIGTGIEASEQSSNAALDTTSRYLVAFLEMIKAMQQREKYNSKKDIRGLDLVLDHLNKGKEVDKTIIPSETADKLTQALKTYHVPFVSMEFKDENGISQTMFVTRDCDRGIFEKAYRMFAMDIGKGLGEMGVEEFIEANKGLTIRRMEGFDPAEIDMIRQNLVLEGVSFAIVRNEADPKLSDIMFSPNDADKIEKAVKAMEYDFAGVDGRTYHDNLNKDIRARQEFVQKAIPKGDETIVIANADNPSRFITVHGNKFIVHHLTAVKEQQRDGTTRTVIKDVLGVPMQLHRKDLMKYVDGLLPNPSGPGSDKNPPKAVITDLNKMNFVIGFTQEGRAIIDTEKFGQDIGSIKEDLSKIEGYNRTKLRDIDDIGKIYSLEKLSEADIADITAKMKEMGVIGQVIVAGDAIAFSDKDKKIMDKVLDATIYKDKSPIQKLCDRFYYEDRGSFDISNNTDTFLFKSPSANNQMREYTLQVDKDGLTIFKGTEVQQHIDKYVDNRLNPDFEETLCSLINAMPEPVCIKDEPGISPEEMEERFNKQLQDYRENPAIERLKDFEDYQKKDVFDAKSPEATLGLNSKQKQAVKGYYSHKTVDTYVDRTLLEKITDMNVDTKLRQENKDKYEYDR